MKLIIDIDEDVLKRTVFYREFRDLNDCVTTIKALEKATPLDKIRAEIEHVIDYTYDSTDYDKALYNGAYKDGLYEALDIIDKYR